MKKGKYLFTFLQPILSFSCRVSPDLFISHLLYPFPQIHIKHEY